jgi:hypothetical protein
MEISIPRSEAGRAVMPDFTTGASSGDYVVPQYSSEGRKLTRGAVVGGGSEDTNPAKRKIASFFERKGGERAEIDTGGVAPVIPKAKNANRIKPPPPPPPPRKKGARVKVAVELPSRVEQNEPSGELYEPITATVEQPKPDRLPGVVQGKEYTKTSFTVVFHTKLGRIKSIVDAILESDTGLCLVYADEQQISYEPDQGTELSLILPDKREVEVMSVGLKFSWYDSNQQLLTFIKTEVDNEA